MAHKERIGLPLAILFLSGIGAAIAQLPATHPAATRLAGDWRSSGPVTIPASRAPVLSSSVSAAVLGEAPSGTRLERMILLLEPSSEQQQALTAELSDLQNPASPEYRQWLSPAAFAAAYGNSASDVSAVSDWLRNQGFDIAPLPAGRGWIEFSGTVAQVEQAFHTQVLNIAMTGGTRPVLAGNISVPGALEPVIHGLVSLDGALSVPALTTPQPVTSTVAELEATTSVSQAEAVTPQLMAQLLHLDVLQIAGVTGAGETIAIAARSTVHSEDIAAFRTAFGLPAKPLKVISSDRIPELAGGPAGDEAEAALEASWAGVAAPGAQIVLVPAATTGATDGLDLSLAAIVDQAMAHTVTVGYSACEAALSEAHQAFYAALYRQAAAQGMAVIAATGDSGSAACHAAGSDTRVVNGYGVSALASTPWDTAVGVTAFGQGVSGLEAWSPVNAADPDYAGGGGASALHRAPVWQAEQNQAGAMAHANTQAAKDPGKPIGATETTLNQQLKAAGLSSGFRLLPDLALPAALDSGGNRGLAFCLSGNVTSSGCTLVRAGGSSVAAALFSGIAALVAEKYGPPGNVAPHLYALSQLPEAGDVFDDVKQGGAQLSCAAGSPGCGASGQIGFAAGAGYDMATGLGSVNAQALVDQWPTAQATGTAQANVSLSISPVVPNATYNPSAVVTLTASVVDPLGSGVPTQNVTFMNGATNTALPSTSSAPSTVTLDATGRAYFSFNLGAAFTSLGSYSFVAQYSGDTTYAGPVLSAPVYITTEQSSTVLSVAPSITSGSLAFNSTITVNVTAGVSSTSASPAGSAPPTGQITLQVAGGPIASSYTGTLVTSNGVTTATFPSVTFTSAGQFMLQATYPGDTNYTAATSTPVTVTVTQATPTVVLTPSTISPSPGGTLTLTATVTPPGSGAISPSGTVTFVLDGQVVGSPQAINATSLTPNITIPSPSLGTHTVLATYSGDTNYASASSTGVTITVAQIAPTALTLTPATATPAPGSSLQLTARLTTTISGTTTPTGTVKFTLDGVQQGALIPISGLTATTTITVPMTGSHNLQAVYSGDANYVSVSSAVVPISVALVATTTVVTSSNYSPSPGSSIQATATVTPSSLISTLPTGTVTFTFNGIVEGVQTLVSGTAVSTTFPVPSTPGAYLLQATYSGDTYYATSTSTLVSITVSKFPTTTVISPATGSPAAGSPLVVTGSITPTTVGPALPTGTFSVTEDGAAVGAIASVTPGHPATASVTLPALIPGTHVLQGTYSGDAYYATSTSFPPVTVTVAKSPTAIAISPITLTPTAGSTLQVSATITTTVPLTTQPSGTVTLYLDGVSQVSGTVSPGSPSMATVSIPVFTAGSHILTATYSGDTYYTTSSTTAGVTIIVNKGATTTLVSATPSALTAGIKETLTATVAPTNAVTGTTYTITGSVTFYDNGSVLLGSAPLVNDVATLSGLTLANNIDHSITAIYAGDGNWLGSVSTALPLAASTLPDFVVLTSNISTVAPGQAVILTATVTPNAPPAATGEQNPTGLVVFYNGTTMIGKSALVAVPLTNSSTATLTISTLPAGQVTITAAYLGDLYYDAATSNQLLLTIQDFTITPNPANPATNLNIVQGSSGSAMFDIKGLGGFNGQIQVVCAVAAQDLPMTCTASPQQVTPDATVTFIVQTFDTGATIGSNRERRTFWPRAAGGSALALLVFFLLPFGRRARIFAGKSRRFSILLLLLVGLGGAGVGCTSVSLSGGSSASGGTPLGVSTLKITASDYVDNTVFSRSVYLTVNVQPKP